MGEKYLTLEQNVCAARIFLNTFGFKLEDICELNEFSKIKIYDNLLNNVGELYFSSGKVIMSAKYSNTLLTARYDIAKISGFVDTECNNALFGQWSSKINFQIESENTDINGEFLVGNTADSQFGITCLCHPLINYTISKNENITIKILRDGLTFCAEINLDNCKEKIYIRPWDNMNGFFIHDIKIGKYDEEKHGYQYRKYAGIFNGSSYGENKNKLHVFLTEEEYDNTLCCHDEYVPKINSDESTEILIQKGLLMQKLDKSLFEKIIELRNLLTIGNVSLLDNLISVCYDNYNDEEINALLGIDRKRMIYQNGAENLTNSYFGIGKESAFLSLEQQKRLLEKQ